MFRRLLMAGYSALVLLTGCSGEGNPGPNPTPPLHPTPHSLAQQAYVKASNAEAGDGFGAGLALVHDTLAVGAPFEASSATGVNENSKQGDNSAPNSGAVYLYTITNGTWTQQAYVKASNTEALDGGGGGVALGGSTLAGGAPFEDSSAKGLNGNADDNGAADSGAVYIFTKANGVWTQQAYVKASNTEASDSFGGPIALAGDLLAVGASSEDSKATGINGDENDNGAFNSGAVYVFSRTNGSWAQEAYVKASNTEARDGFGWNVALDGDTLVVGAPGEDSSATGFNGDQGNNNAADSGAVYVFTRGNGGWTQQAYLKASNTGAGDRFGSSVALAGNTLVVGAPSEASKATGINGDESDNNASNSGAAYVFTRANGVWTQQAYIKASNSEAGDSFGGRVALSGETLIVGAPSEASSATGINDNAKQGDNSARNSGAAYVFTRANGVWTQQAYMKASNSEAGDNFGGRVAVTGNTFAVESLGEDSGATGINDNAKQGDNSAPQSGAVYVMQ